MSDTFIVVTFVLSANAIVVLGVWLGQKLGAVPPDHGHPQAQSKESDDPR